MIDQVLREINQTYTYIIYMHACFSQPPSTFYLGQAWASPSHLSNGVPVIYVYSTALIFIILICNAQHSNSLDSFDMLRRRV